jgi:hypothetical protein
MENTKIKSTRTRTHMTTITHKTEREARGLNKEHNSCNRNQVCIMKTKPNENETWIGSDKKAGDVDRRTPPEQGEGPTSEEVVTII